MAQTITIGDVVYDVPDELDWELGEVAEVARLRDEYGDVGATIGMVWVVVHRKDPSFTVAQAKQIKISSVKEPEGADDPLASAAPPENGTTGSANGSSSTVEHEPSGVPLSSGSTS